MTRGEVLLRGSRTVVVMGGGGSRGIVLHSAIPGIEIGDRFRQSIMADGSIRLTKVGAARKLDKRRRRG